MGCARASTCVDAELVHGALLPGALLVRPHSHAGAELEAVHARADQCSRGRQVERTGSRARAPAATDRELSSLRLPWPRDQAGSR
eukprot:6341874-Prymnesium_polylepis.1